ncbi:TMEM165/GDT1 family protein [Feifania hominis]|uniref:GDT1 family protein n=1 Tax=Feifania hominis TaxID=2763660 RepID=A0A926HUI2_9FIRM|nr:TMEM165/GDT1 family protein [Feifania hominis]MBC8535970.1 TMEM165/GDT1 family protein [Feifania hominis]
MLHVVWSSFVLVCLAEMADKTQFLVIGLASKYKLRQLVVGITCSVILLNLFAVVLGRALSTLIPLTFVELLAGLSFLVFAVMTLRECDDEDCQVRQGRFVSIAIAIAFFAAELGDKTQLGAISLAATNPGEELGVFLGATAGLLVADGIGVAIGLCLGRKLPERLMKAISFCVFSVFGIVTLYDPLRELLGPQAAACGAAGLMAALAACYLHMRKRA